MEVLMRLLAWPCVSASLFSGKPGASIAAVEQTSALCPLRTGKKPGTSLRPDIAQAVLCDGGLIA